ncbi:MAG: hypothetical protein M0Z69_07960, partial [Actinomycetota bacterium]|nr:hypothetical protein [Actinomycetota bacterium]
MTGLVARPGTNVDPTCPSPSAVPATAAKGPRRPPRPSRVILARSLACPYNTCVTPLSFVLLLFVISIVAGAIGSLVGLGGG